MNCKATFIINLLLLFTGMSFAQESAINKCEVLKYGTFKYLDAIDTSAYMVMDGIKQANFSENGKYVIESNIDWISDCSYIMTMTNSTHPNFPHKPGDQMKVDITKIEDDIIYYTATVKKQRWEGRFKKL